MSCPHGIERDCTQKVESYFPEEREYLHHCILKGMIRNKMAISGLSYLKL
jgi:hypothetical protein